MNDDDELKDKKKTPLKYCCTDRPGFSNKKMKHKKVHK